jgi:sec-independent protein translocase protein TatC
MFFAFGIAFEVPIAVILLARMGVIEPDTLARKRPYVILWAFVVAAVITPPDVFSQFFLAVPMIILFEAGLFVARWMKRAADAAVASGRRDLTDEEIETEFKKHDEAFAGPEEKNTK